MFSMYLVFSLSRFSVVLAPQPNPPPPPPPPPHPPTEHARGYANYWILIYIKEKLIVVEMPTCGLRVTACKTCDLVVCIPPQLLNTHGDGWLRRQHR